MLQFCPICGDVLFVPQTNGNLTLKCKKCPYFFNIASTISSKTYCKLKEVDDVLGGEEAWKNVDQTEERCPKCSYPRAYFMQIQTRSADEPMTTFYRCAKHQCSHNWRD